MPNARECDKRDSKQTKHWSVTLNNPIEGVDYVINHPEGQGNGRLWFPWLFGQAGRELLRSCWGQLEQGGNLHTPHLQLHFVTHKIHRGQSFGKQVNDILFPNDDGKGRAHAEPVKDIDEHKDYVTKEETRVYGPFKKGVIQGRGGDSEKKQSATKQLIKDVHKVIAGDLNVRDLWMQHAPMMLLRHKGVNEMCNALSVPQPRPNMKTIVLYGPAGTGKTHLAHKLANELFPEESDVFVKNQGKWWDRYTGQPVVIMDDFQGTCVNVDTVKVLFDKGPMIAEVKGGSVPIRTQLIFVTTNVLPQDWYRTKLAEGQVTQGDIDAVLSRIGLNTNPDVHPERVNQGLFVEFHTAGDYERNAQVIRDWLKEHWAPIRRAVVIDDDDDIPIPAAPVYVQDEDDIICLNDLPAEIRQNDARPVIRDLLRLDWGGEPLTDDEEDIDLYI